MEIKRFYISKENITGDIVKIDGEEFLHLTKVLRYKVGFKIIVCNNFDGFDYYATISEIFKNYAIANIEGKIYNDAISDRCVKLFQALPKGDKLDFIVQKAVELGVSEIVVFNSQFVNESKFNLERLKKIAIEACKQCGRAFVPKIEDLLSYNEAVDYASQCDVALMAYENEEILSARVAFENAKFCKSLALIVGSEGGFSESEVESARNIGIKSFTLGKRILRCETAGIVACSLLMYEIGELGG